MHSTGRIGSLCISGFIVLNCLGRGPATYADGNVGVIVEDSWGRVPLQKIVSRFSTQSESSIVLEEDCLHLERFVKAQCSVVALTVRPSAAHTEWIYGFRANQISKTACVVAQAKVLAVVHVENPGKVLSYEQLQLVLGRNGLNTTWSQVGGVGGKVRVYGEPLKSTARRVLWTTAMRKVADSPERSLLPFGDNWQACLDREEVLRKVKADRNGVGFVLCGTTLPTGVKVLAIQKSAAHPAVSPCKEPYLQLDYPLSEPLVLYLHPTKPEAAKRFCEFAVGPEGSAIAETFGLTTPWQEARYRGQQRLVQMKAGSGPRITANGVLADRSLVQALAENYVLAKSLLQVAYQSAESQKYALGSFVQSSGGKSQELLFLPELPSERSSAMDQSRSSLKECQQYLPGAHSVGLAVHPSSKLSSLSLEQLRSILSGQTDDWKLLGLTPGKLFVYGLPPANAASKILSKEVLDLSRARALKPRKDTAEVLAAISVDPQGIGIVDLSALPIGHTVKLLSIGPSIRPVAPTLENIRTGVYPLTQRLYLYVHPKASDTAKDFAAFIAAGECDETFRKHGLIPLSEKAIKASLSAATRPAPQEVPKAKGKKP